MKKIIVLIFVMSFLLMGRVYGYNIFNISYPNSNQNYDNYFLDLNFTYNENGYCSYWKKSNLTNGLVGHWAFEGTPQSGIIEGSDIVQTHSGTWASGRTFSNIIDKDWSTYGTLAAGEGYGHMWANYSFPKSANVNFTAKIMNEEASPSYIYFYFYNYTSNSYNLVKNFTGPQAATTFTINVTPQKDYIQDHKFRIHFKMYFTAEEYVQGPRLYETKVEYSNDATTVVDYTDKSNTGTWNGYTNNDGTLQNSPTWTSVSNYSARGNNALDFDGSDDYVGISDNSDVEFNSGESFSMFLWVKLPDHSESTNGLITKGYADTSGATTFYILGLRDNGVISFLANNDTNGCNSFDEGTDTVNDNEWHHVGVVRNSNTDEQIIYVDGDESANLDISSDDCAAGVNSDDLVLMNHYNRHTNGTIDEVRIWNKALNESEIQEEMDSHIPIHGNGLVSSWSFEKGSGSTAYDTNNYIKGDYRAGGRFDGVDDYVNTTHQHNFSNGITASIWFKTDTADGYDRLLETRKNIQDGIVINFKPSAYLESKAWDSTSSIAGVSSNVDYADGQWHHLVISWDGTTNTNSYKLYVDNNLEDSDTPTSTITNTPDNLMIGKYVGGSGHEFNGTIDEVQIHNRALSSTEIERLYNSTKDNFIVENDTVNTNLLNYTRNGTKTVYAQCHGEDVVNADVTFDINPIEIRFRDNFTSETVQNFTVTFDSNDYSSKAYSTTNGVVKLNMRDVEADNVEMELKATNYDTRTITRDIHEAFDVTYDMTPAGIYIYAFDEWDNSNLSSFQITAYTGSKSSNFTSNSSSYFVNASLMPTGSITVKIESSTYEAREYFMTNSLYDYSKLNAYLLPSTRSNNVLFSVRSDTGTYLEGVDIDVKKYLSGAWSVVGEGETDSSGSIEFNLNTETEYQLTFIKSGYGTQTVTIIPVLSHYEVRLNTTVDLEYEDVWEGIEYYIEPEQKALMKNDTANFKFNVTDHYSDLEWFSMNITNSTNYVLFDNVTTSSSGGIINYSTTLTNYVNQTLTLTGKFKRSGFGTVTITKDYYVYNYEKKGWTLKDLFDALSNETHGVTKEQGGLIMMVFVAAAMSGAALVVGTVGAGAIGLIILSFVAFIGVIDWVVFSFLALLIAAIMYLKGRL